jgi:hypothetical protein
MPKKPSTLPPFVVLANAEQIRNSIERFSQQPADVEDTTESMNFPRQYVVKTTARIIKKAIKRAANKRAKWAKK